MTPHVHAKEIHAFADGYEIEHWRYGKWEVSTTPMWWEEDKYRIKDPYRELKEAAADPTKQIRLRTSGVWIDGDFGIWGWDSPPEHYEIRDKPKAKVKMWQWIFKDAAGMYYISTDFRKDKPVNSVQHADWTMIEVEE